MDLEKQNGNGKMILKKKRRVNVKWFGIKRRVNEKGFGKKRKVNVKHFAKYEVKSIRICKIED